MHPVSAKTVLDYFKIFKIFDLKKIHKHGDVKLTQNKALARKVLHVDGNVSTQNYIIFDNQSAITSPGMTFFPAVSVFDGVFGQWQKLLLPAHSSSECQNLQSFVFNCLQSP